MVILKQPNSLNFSGNLSDIILNDDAPVSLKLYKDAVLILEEVYAPDSEDTIIIRLKEVVDGLLSVSVPTTDLFHQVSAYSDFTVILNDVENIPFKVIKGGIDADVIDVDLFTKSNFLTWQPQQKIVKFFDPEWLTYYSKEASQVKAKGYFATSDETINLVALPEDQLSSFNVNFGHLISLFPSQPLYVDIWVELAAVRVSYIQRFILSTEEFEFEDVFTFENSLGGVESIRLTGEKVEVENFKFDSALFDENVLDYHVTPDQLFEKNTGFFRSDRERTWSLEFFKSLQKYYNQAGALKRIIISKPTLESIAGELAQYKFNFAYSKQTKFLNLPRPDVVPPELEIVGPDEELFFLAPNLNILPNAPLENIYFPVQSAFANIWYKLSLVELTDFIRNDVVLSLPPIDLSNYYTKAQTQAFFAGNTLITGYNKANWDTAHSWGDHTAAGYALAANVYTKTETQNYFSGAAAITGYNKTNWDTAHSWGNHSTAGYATAANVYTKTEIQNYFSAAAAITGYNKTNWDNAHGWGNHALAGYATSSNTWTKAEADGRFIKNQFAFQAGAEINIPKARIKDLLSIPKAAPNTPDVEAGEYYLYVDPNGLGGSGTPPAVITSLAQLSDIALNSPSNNQLLRYNATTSKWENWTPNFTVDLSAYSTTAQGDARWLGIGATAVNSAKWNNQIYTGASNANPSGELIAFDNTNLDWRPTTLAQLGDGRYLGINATAVNSTKWAGLTYTGTDTGVDTYLMAYQGGVNFGVASQAGVRSFLGLGTAAYLNASQNPTSNSVVQRDVNGYIFTNYLNMSSPSVDAVPMTDFVTTAGDGYLRRNSASAVQSFLGLGSAAYLNASYSAIGSSVVQRNADRSVELSLIHFADGGGKYLYADATGYYFNGLGYLGSNAFSSTAYLPLTAGFGSQLSGSLYINGGNVLSTISSLGSVYTVMQSDNTAGYLGTNTAHPLHFRTDSTIRYTIDVSGNNTWTGSGTFGGALTGTSATFSGAVTASDYLTNGWFRNNTLTYGLYNESAGIHWYAQDANYWVSSSARGIILREGHAGALKGYLYYDGDGFGLLNDLGGWSVRTNYGSAYGGTLYGSWNVTGNLDAQTGSFTNTSYFSSNNNSSTSYSVAAIQLRESNGGSSGAYLPPRLAFHWGGVVASQIGIEASGRIAILNNPGTGYEDLIAKAFTASASIVSPEIKATTKLEIPSTSGAVYQLYVDDL